MGRSLVDANGEHDEVEFEATSLFGTQTRRGLVVVRLGAAQVQMTIAKAREIRDMLTDCIEASLADELLIRFLTDEVHLPLERAAGALLVFRKYRQEVTGTEPVDE